MTQQSLVKTIIEAPTSGIPGLIYTTRGFMPECLLRREKVVQDFPDATVNATEFYVGTEQVRRDVNLALKSKDVFQIEAKEL